MTLRRFLSAVEQLVARGLADETERARFRDEIYAAPHEASAPKASRAEAEAIIARLKGG